jgi:hypothetical protein
MVHRIQYLEFIGDRPRNLRNQKLFDYDPFYQLHFEVGSVMEIVDDDFVDAGVIPKGIATEYARKYPHLLRIVTDDLSDDDYIQLVLEKLIDEFGVDKVAKLASLYLPVDEEDTVNEKVTEVLNAKASKPRKKSSTRKKSNK